MATVTMRYWAAAKDAAGVPEQNVTADTLAEALAGVLRAVSAAGAPQDSRTADSRTARLQAVFARSSFLVDGDPVGRRAADAVQLRDGSVIEVLPPFAGG